MKLRLTKSIVWCPPLTLSLSRNDTVDDGERGRPDRSRRRPADELAAPARAHQTVSGICRTRCSARRRTERPRRSGSPFPTASFLLREREPFPTLTEPPRARGEVHCR